MLFKRKFDDFFIHFDFDRGGKKTKCIQKLNVIKKKLGFSFSFTYLVLVDVMDKSLKINIGKVPPIASWSTESMSPAFHWGYDWVIGAFYWGYSVERSKKMGTSFGPIWIVRTTRPSWPTW